MKLLVRVALMNTRRHLTRRHTPSARTVAGSPPTVASASLVSDRDRRHRNVGSGSSIRRFRRRLPP